jgi:Transmembrane protein 65
LCGFIFIDLMNILILFLFFLPGQVISDVSGVVFGGALERFLTTRTSWLPAPNLTAVQRQLPLCRNVAMAGAVCGVILGCALGATTLLAVDLEARHRIERAQRLRDIVQDMIGSSSAGSVGVEVDRPFCDACTVHIVSTKDLTLPDQAESSQSSRTVTLQDLTVGTPDERAAVQRCIQSRTIAVHDGVLYAPVLRGDTVMAVVAFSNLHDRNEADEERFFPQEADVVTARVMARHIAIFMDRLAE